MKKLLYIPVSSLNFNSIFSTESISPHSFYNNRSFGYKRNKQSSYQPNDDCLLLYSKLFQYNISNSDYEEYPLFIGIAEEIATPLIRKKITADNFVISVVDSTIYFDTTNFIFIFPSEEIQKIVISKSSSSFETKTVSKYQSCFRVIDDFKNEIIEITLPEITFTSDHEKEIQKDEEFDSLKGLFYCLLIGYFFSKPQKLLDIEIVVKQILNEFNGFKTDIELENNLSGLSYSKNWSISTKKYKSILSKIDFLKAKIIATFGKSNKEDFIKNFISALNLDFEVLKPFFVIDGHEEFIYKKAQHQNPNPEYIVSELYDIVELYFYNKTNAYQKEKLDNEFNDRLNQLNIILQNIFQPTIKDDDLELVKSLAVQLSRFEFYSFFTSQKISEPDFNLFQIICSILLKNRKRHKGETEIEIKNKILEQLGKIVNQKFGEESDERNYLLEFYKLLNNKSHNFQINNSKYISLQSFVAFLINIDSAERLEEFIITHNLNRIIALSFFGLYNGFSGLGRTLTDKIFVSNNFRLLNTIDSALLNRTIEIPETKPLQIVNESQSVPKDTPLKKENKSKEKKSTKARAKKKTKSNNKTKKNSNIKHEIQTELSFMTPEKE